MSILSLYIFRYHIGPFLFGAATVIFIFLMQFLLRFLDELIGKGLDISIILQLILYNVAWMTVLAVPLGVLFSTLMAFGNLSFTYEIAVIKSGGASLLRLMRPSIFMGIFLTIALFWFNDKILPNTNHSAKTLMSDIQRTRPTFALASGKFSTDLFGYTIHSRKIDSITGLMENVTIYDYSQNMKINIVNADSGTILFSPDYSKLILHLYNGEIHQSQTNDTKNYRKVNFKEYLVPITASGYGFAKSEDGVTSRGQREMNINDMTKIRDESLVRAENYNKKILVEFNSHLRYLLKGETLELVNNKKSIINSKEILNDEKNKTLNSLPNSKFNLNEENYIINDKKRNSQKLNNKNKIIFDTNFVDAKDINSNIETRNKINYSLTLLNSSLYNNNEQYNSNFLYANEYEVEIQKKYAIPFACIVFVFVGCPLGIRTKGGNIGISAIFTLGFYIIYWACLIGGESLADKGQISPFMGMWMGNILLFTFGILLSLKVNNESFSLLKFIGLEKLLKMLRK